VDFLGELLADYVLENYARPIQTDLDSWLSSNPLPCICDCNYGGMRIFLFKSGDNLVIVGKNGGIYTPRANPKVFSMVTEFVHAPHRMILDGEYVAGEGIHLFDVLQVDNRDLRIKPLELRRVVLDEIVSGMNLETRSCLANNVGEILQFRNDCISRGHQGVIAKNLRSGYGTADSWLDLGRNDTLCCFVTDSEITNKDCWSWSIGLLDQKNGRLVNLGEVSSFSEKIKPQKVAVGSVVEVKFSNIGQDMKLREPFIVRVRHDRAPSECLTSQLDYALKILKSPRL
jgi:ATP-dependent DNA ligase